MVEGFRNALMLLFVLVVVGTGTGCAASTHIYVKSSAQTNDGNTLYMMIRNAEGKTVVNESYPQVAAKLFVDPADPTVISSQPIFPGNTVQLTLDESDKKEVIIYFFYTTPGANWRVPLHKPLPAEVYIDLGDHQIERVQIRKR